MKQNITPIGLKGNEINERMKELMGITTINENRGTSVVELTKVGPDGNVYGIVRENHEYYIKTANKSGNLVAEDFSYIGGLQNKKQEAYPSYAKAIKHLNLKFNSLNEAYGKSGQINVFEDDKLMAEDAAGFVNMGNAFTNEAETKDNPWAICTASVGREDKAKYEKCVKDVKKEKGIEENITESEFMGNDVELTEVEQNVEDMMDETKDIESIAAPVKENKLSIERSLSNMDSIIESIVGENKKKVYTLK